MLKNNDVNRLYEIMPVCCAVTVVGVNWQVKNFGDFTANAYSLYRSIFVTRNLLLTVNFFFTTNG